MSGDYIIVFVTTKDKSEAEKISKALLADRLIACANIVGPVTSFFSWMNKTDCAEEFLVVMKSRRDLLDAVVDCVKGLHSYEVPEVLAFPVVGGSGAYLDWMAQVLK
jgi:periplasmic divalent cation tolerance protein